MFAAHEPSDIDRFFRGLTEYAFHSRLGVVDPPLVDYVALLLVRFLRHDAVVPPPAEEASTTDVARLLMAAREHDPSEALAEYRQIGDYTLFWSGLYPEAVERRRPSGHADQLIDFREAGKRAYWLASTLEPEDAAEERRLFERLSHEYDLCVEGLGEVRRAWGDAA
jgi:hypothetical protein